jgi:hypothetical protein
MADHVTEEELQPEQTEGFKVGEKKTIDEYQKLGKFALSLLSLSLSPLHRNPFPQTELTIEQTKTMHPFVIGRNLSVLVQVLLFPTPKTHEPA